MTEVFEDREHFVQFYESDEFVLGSLGEYVNEGFARGEACVVVATLERGKGLEAYLRARGHDTWAARSRGHFLSLDAAQVLPRVMERGAPEPSRFEEVVAGLVRRAGAGGRRVRVFGELVALLCGAGNYDAALRLEGLWNDFQRRHAFRLFCAYPNSQFKGESQSGHLAHVCAEHTRVVPAESCTSAPNEDGRGCAVVELPEER